MRDSSGNEPIDTIDTNGDGIADCYVYEYVYETASAYIFSIPIFPRTEVGKVYIYSDKSPDYFENKQNIPEGFVDGHDLLVADLKAEDNPTLYAYRAGVMPERKREGIVDVLLEYSNNHIPNWGRTKKSLLIEWNAHSLFAPFSKRAMHIDFDRNEEGRGYVYFLKKAIKAFFS